MFFRILALLSLSLVSQWVHANSSDHPLLNRYPGADVRSRLFIQYEQVDLPSGPVDADGQLPTESLIGDLARITYTLKNVSTLKVYENYREALNEAGATVLNACELEQCGSDDSAKELAEGVSGGGNVGNQYRKPFFVRARLNGARGNIDIALFIGGHESKVWVQQVIVEEVPLQNGLVTVDDEYLAKAAEVAQTGDRRTPEEKQQDHPMIARYPGAELKWEKSAEYERVSIPIGTFGAEGAAPESMELTGDTYQFTYQVRNVSTLKVYQNYLQALEKLGFSVLYSCELDECGGRSAADDLGDLVAIKGVFNFYRKPYYVVASREGVQGRASMALYIGGYDGDVHVQQTVVEENGRETDLIAIDADELYQDIQQTGKALIYGIYFDTDSATLKSESGEALQAISDLLKSHPDLNLYVVGHTDDTGEGDYNLSLSSRRASSVVDALKTDYSIDDDRLKPAGVGPYAPVAGNESDEGRRLNRRVELVRRL